MTSPINETLRKFTDDKLTDEEVKNIIENSEAPTSATDTGTTGTISWDADYIYICIATNTWKRTAISTW